MMRAGPFAKRRPVKQGDKDFYQAYAGAIGIARGRRAGPRHDN